MFQKYPTPLTDWAVDVEIREKKGAKLASLGDGERAVVAGVCVLHYKVAHTPTEADQHI